MNQIIQNRATLLILVRDHEDFAQSCAESINMEINSGIPIILIDTGSKDRSVEIFLNFLDKKREIKIINSERSKTTLENLKIGISEINTPYMILLSCDDYFDQGYGQALDKILLIEDKENVYNFRHKISPKIGKKKKIKSPRWSNSNSVNKMRLSLGNPGTTAGAVIPTNPVKTILNEKNVPQTLIEDYWLWWQLVDIVKLQNAKNGYVHYRKHPKSVSQSSKSEPYAKSLGFSAALPQNPTNPILNRFLSLILIPRWIRHLNWILWPTFMKSYIHQFLTGNHSQ